MEDKIKVKAIVEVLGKPKEHVQQAVELVLKKIKEDNNKIELLKEDTADVKETENGFFSTFSEIEIEAENPSALLNFCFDYMPSSVDILEPDDINFKNSILSSTLNDLQAKLHKMDMLLKQTMNENKFLRINSNKLLRNLIYVVTVKEPRTKEFIQQYTGLGEKDLDIFLKKLVEIKALAKEGELYSWLGEDVKREEQS